MKSFFRLVIRFGMVVCLASQAFATPEAPSIPAIPDAPSDLGGDGLFPVTDPDPVPPTQPNFPTLKVSGSVENGAFLIWTAPPIPVERYIVEMRSFSSPDWTQIAVTTTAVTSFRHTGVVAGRRYHYRVVPIVKKNGEDASGPPIGPTRWIEHQEGGRLQVRTRMGSASVAGYLGFKEPYKIHKDAKIERTITGGYNSWVQSWRVGYTDEETSEAKYSRTIEKSISLTGDEEKSGSGSSSLKSRTFGGYQSYGNTKTMLTVDSTMTMGNDGIEVWTGHRSYQRSGQYLNGEAWSEPSEETDINSYAWSGSGAGNPQTTIVRDSSGLKVTINSRTTYSYPSSNSDRFEEYIEKITVSNPVEPKDVLPVAKTKLPAWKDQDWIDFDNVVLYSIYYSGMFYGDFSSMSPPTSLNIGWLAANVRELEFRHAFSSQISGEPIKIKMQTRSRKVDDANKDGDQSLGSETYTYNDLSIGSVTRDNRLNCYVSTEKLVPDSGIEANRQYTISRVYVGLFAGDYRGGADDDEKNADSSFANDPDYSESETPEYYWPEPQGPAIFLNSETPGAAYVSTFFGGGHDSSEWTGTLTWSGASVIVKMGGKTVSSPINLGKQGKEYKGGAQLTITAPDGATPGTVNFTLSMRDSKGSVIGTDSAKVHLVNGPTPEFEKADPLNDYYTIPINDATGPVYRKVSLYGRPVPDAKPGESSESDSTSEETYIDAFSQGLRHSVTDIFVRVPSSDLVLSVRRNTEAEVWNFAAGLRPHERPDRPFGSGWSSNLGSNIEFIDFGVDSDGFRAPSEAVVTDDDGNAYRFFEYEGSYFPYPSAPHEAKTYLASLSYNSTENQYTFERKHGKKLIFEPVAGALQVAHDRQNGGGGSGMAYNYARLIKVQDRMQYTLRYEYGGAATLIPSKIQAHRPDGVEIPGQRIFIGQDAGGKVSFVVDPSGKRTTYGYRSFGFSHPKNATLNQRVNLLKSVKAPETNVVEYAYEGENSGVPVVVELDPIPRKKPGDRIDTYQINVSSISQKAQSGIVKFGFEYETDNSRQIFVKVPGFSGYVTQAGAPRRVKVVNLPTGDSTTFLSIGSIRVPHGSSVPGISGSRGCSVIDAMGKTTTYRFDQISVINLTKFKDLFSGQYEFKKPKIIYYSSMTIEAKGVGSESYYFDIDAGLSLSMVSDFSGNETTYKYNDPIPSHTGLFTQILPKGFFRYNDPNIITKGRATTSRVLTYSPNYRILSVDKDERGYSTFFAVDSSGRRTNEIRGTSITNPIERTDYVYDLTWPGFVTQKTVQVLGSLEPNEPPFLPLVTMFTPDSSGRMASKSVQVGGDVLSTNYLYNWNNAKIFVTDPAGIAASPTTTNTLITYDDRHRLKRITHEDDSYKEYSYDGRGRRSAVRDENGNVTEFAYDLADRLVSKTIKIPAGDLVELYRYNKVGSLIETVNPRKFTEKRDYDDIQRLKSLDQPGIGLTQFSYTGKNSGSSIQNPLGFNPTRTVSPRGFVKSVVYDNLYRPLTVSQTYGGGVQLQRYEYDEVGNKIREYDGLENLTNIYYDELNRPILINFADGSSESTRYTSTGLISRKKDRRGYSTFYEYDGAGRLKKTISPAISAGTPVREVAYDRAGNISAVTDERGNTSKFEYTVRNLLRKETRPPVFDAEAGQMAVSFSEKSYDLVGNIVDSWDFRGTRSHFVYDAASRLVRSFSAYGTPSELMTATEYDPCGNPILVTDPKGISTVNTFDSANRLKSTTNGQGITTTFAYDSSGNRTKVTDGKSQTTTFEYDGLNRLIRTIDHSGNVEESRFNAVNRVSRVDSLGRITSYIYDKMNRLKTVSYKDSPADDVTYNYFADGSLKEALQVDSDRSVSYLYDARGSVTRETSNGVAHIYSYDLAGNMTGIKYGGTERELTLGYDALNRLNSVSEGGRLTEYVYTLNGQEAGRTFKADGATIASKITNAYDTLGRLDVRIGCKGTNQIYSFDHDYDAVGNLTNIQETYTGDMSLSNRTVGLIYDNAYRLRFENSSAGGVVTSTEFVYDAADNCAQKKVTVGTGPTSSTTYAYNSLNQLQSANFSDSTPAVSYKYDANGNRVGRVQGVNQTSYSYDGENRLTEVRLGGETKSVDIQPVMGNAHGPATQVQYHIGSSGLHRYSYDYRTRRVKKEEAGVTTKVAFSGGTSVMDLMGAATPSAPTVEYVRGIDMGGGVGGLLYSVRPDNDEDGNEELSFGHYNGRGDVIAKTDNDGSTVYRAAYEARGKRVQESGTTPDIQRANTKDEDPTGLLNDGYRYRDLETGTFLSRDPAGFVDGPNLYAYVRQNPWTNFDPNGLALADNNDMKLSEQARANGDFWGFFNYGLRGTFRELNPFDANSELSISRGHVSQGIHQARQNINELEPSFGRSLAKFGIAGASFGDGFNLINALTDISATSRVIWDQGATEVLQATYYNLSEFVKNDPESALYSLSFMLTSGSFLFQKSGIAAKGSAWTNLPGGVQVRQVGNYWIKQVNPEASSIAQWWGRGSLNAQASGLSKLGDMAPNFLYQNGKLITRDAGAYAPGNFWSTWAKGSSRLGTPFNDIRPRNIGANGIIFDPAKHPIQQGLEAGAAGLGVGVGGWYLYDSMNQ